MARLIVMTKILTTFTFASSSCRSACFLNARVRVHPPQIIRHYTRPFTIHTQLLHSMRDNDNNPANTSSGQQSELEVEKKFPLLNDPNASTNLKQALSSLGFEMTHQEEFVDWYFDLPAPNWRFSLNDIWIRYREKKWKLDKNTYGWRGVWQVKRGKPRNGSEKENDGMTVYEEYQGVAAKEMILDLLCNLENEENCPVLDESTTETLPSSEYNDIPHLDGAEKLVPFSKFKTFRSCWQILDHVEDNNSFKGLKVDIDRTDIGFAVGEVEAVCGSDSNEEAVDLEKKKIGKLVDLLLNSQGNEIGETNCDARSMGKLEYYLFTNSKEHYDACIEAGVI